MQWLAALCVRRPIFASVLILVLCVVGIAGYTQLGVDRFPNIDFPVVVVTTTQPGAAPEDVETEITDKVEEAVNTISGIDELRSVTTEGASQVVVTFLIEKNVDVAAQEVRDRVNTVLPQLPKDIDQPIVQKLDPDASPILYFALRSENHSVRETTEIADKRVRRSLESIDGVGQVLIVGGRKRQINVMLDPIKLRGAGVTVLDVQRAIAAQNLTTPGGRVDTGPGELTVRIHGRVSDPNQIGDLVVRRAEGHSITVRDVGDVIDGEEDADSAAVLNGNNTVLLALRKQSGANTVQVADAVKERVEDIKKQLPAGYSIELVRDESGVIRTSVDAVREHLVAGALLAAFIVFLFLGNLRSTLIAAIAIPTSIIGTFATMWWAGYTLNTITLLALALAVGIVIDDAIVVLENIFRHIEEKHEPPMKAAVEATKEIGLAVMATTLSLIAVFLPVAFMGGIPGKFLRSFGVTMAFAIAVSMLVSFSLTPMMSSRWLKEAEANYKTLGQRVVDRFYRPIERVYGGVLAFLMKRRWIVVIAALATLGSCAPLAMKANKGFLPVNDEARYQVTVRTPEGTSLEETKIATERIARDIRQNPNVKLTVTTVGDDAAHTHNLATVYVLLSPPETRTVTQNDMMDWTRKNVLAKQPKNYRIQAGEVPLFGGGGFSTARVQYTVRGPDLKRLEDIANDVVAKMKKVPGAVDVDSSLIVGKPEIGVYIDRQRAADLGVQPSDIANALRLLVQGEQVSNYEEHGEEYEVHVRAAPKYRADEEGLRLLTVPSAKLGYVALADVVKLGRATGPSRIDRLNRERQVTLLANAAPGYGDGQIAAEMKKIIEGEHLGAGYEGAPTGQTREMARVFKAFIFALILSFVFMYLVLAAQFESWLHPITILLSLPLTLPFAFLSIIVFKQAIDIYSVLGILVLFGVVKKNAILQIDHTNQLRAAGMNRLDAILHANRDRLRPILMTTAAFVAGMIPLVMSRGVGSGFNRATAGVVVGGQILSLFLTLVATPVAYSFFDDLAAFLRRLFRMKPAEYGEPAANPAE
ncbi:MAG TPA: efflux RND transporter permease subunit [Polyangiaceae bacterium]